MTIGGIAGGSAEPSVLIPTSAPAKGTASSGSGSPGSSSSGSAANSVSVFARANGSVTTTITDPKGNVVSSNTTTLAKPVGAAGSVLDVKA